MSNGCLVSNGGDLWQPAVLLLWCCVTGCTDGKDSGGSGVDTSYLSGTISVASITPEPGSELPELGETLRMVFTDVTWEVEGARDDDRLSVVAWFK